MPIPYDMVHHMKTTVDIADELLRTAKQIARNEGSTLRALIEEGLRFAVAQRATPTTFRLRSARFEGRGLQAGVREGDWDQIRGMIYGGQER